MVLRIHGKDESVVRFRQGAPLSRIAAFVKNVAFYLHYLLCKLVTIPSFRDKVFL